MNELDDVNELARLAAWTDRDYVLAMLHHGYGYTLSELSSYLHLSRERTRQIITRSMRQAAVEANHDAKVPPRFYFGYRLRSLRQLSNRTN